MMSFKDIQKVDILAIGVHPDDIELSCSGTLLSHKEKGYSIGLLDLSLGELGTRGNAELRTVEALSAAQMMQATFRYQLNLRDGFFDRSEEEMRSVIRIIRQAKPTLVLANALNDRHPDHGRSAKLVSDACFYSGLEKIVTINEEGSHQERWRPKMVLHYLQDRQSKPDLVIDISKYIEQKIELIRCFKSQFYDPDSKESETPISGMDFIEIIKSNNKSLGRPLSFAYAEGFHCETYFGVNDLMCSFGLK